MCLSGVPRAGMQTFGGWVSADGVCRKTFQKCESTDGQIIVVRRSAVLVIAVASLQAQCLQTVEGERRPRRLDAIEPTAGPGDPAKSPLRPWLNSPCQTVVRQAVLAAATH